MNSAKVTDDLVLNNLKNDVTPNKKFLFKLYNEM